MYISNDAEPRTVWCGAEGKVLDQAKLGMVDKRPFPPPRILASARQSPPPRLSPSGRYSPLSQRPFREIDSHSEPICLAVRQLVR
ncbi:MAG: hypothetical protein A3C30_01245 [Candidatus Levybacteria bacterium RIFCSPHIGHO2_02_FULL_40_18]|nr:MAG: hypothetical protein A2869_00810 [Candidatus Levybacteria bacterium RIFCSPHIGHO2_01_FULL_40_58]OGH26629.1 MAG: hypothetical protein A3C30_01245 [Candidatus Levybacteria bacterium RIFCSPHIGHO2_02_FULL_40_18]OGH31158.1 MAG: hypothetical protein A3E43_00080 [Candidatus Levybacteria bacterium RIFCSPHIGHO2_12_FULL_40_31]OGH39840.1 MAG: hypothetical protein A2894_03585 [Candidatus Levybacteria bacterium RIFCSPLOWO2_01_FULL_40_64]OGH48864.1 MAG: hypothetical protein A3I54_04690 [Candidatus Lev